MTRLGSRGSGHPGGKRAGPLKGGMTRDLSEDGKRRFSVSGNQEKYRNFFHELGSGVG